mgnify:CR=1 FL=1
MTMPNTSSGKSISTVKTYREMQIRRCIIFILPPCTAINMPHSSFTALRSTGIGRQRLPLSVCSDTWLVLSKAAWRMNAKAEKTASTASCGGKSRRKNRLRDCDKDRKTVQSAKTAPSSTLVFNDPFDHIFKLQFVGRNIQHHVRQFILRIGELDSVQR